MLIGRSAKNGEEAMTNDPYCDPIEERASYLMKEQLIELRLIRKHVSFLATIGAAAFCFTAIMIFFGGWG